MTELKLLSWQLSDRGFFYYNLMTKLPTQYDFLEIKPVRRRNNVS